MFNKKVSSAPVKYIDYSEIRRAHKKQEHKTKKANENKKSTGNKKIILALGALAVSGAVIAAVKNKDIASKLDTLKGNIIPDKYINTSLKDKIQTNIKIKKIESKIINTLAGGISFLAATIASTTLVSKNIEKREQAERAAKGITEFFDKTTEETTTQPEIKKEEKVYTTEPNIVDVKEQESVNEIEDEVDAWLKEPSELEDESDYIATPHPPIDKRPSKEELDRLFGILKGTINDIEFEKEAAEEEEEEEDYSASTQDNIPTYIELPEEDQNTFYFGLTPKDPEEKAKQSDVKPIFIEKTKTEQKPELENDTTIDEAETERIYEGISIEPKPQKIIPEFSFELAITKNSPNSKIQPEYTFSRTDIENLKVKEPQKAEVSEVTVPEYKEKITQGRTITINEFNKSNGKLNRMNASINNRPYTGNILVRKDGENAILTYENGILKTSTSYKKKPDGSYQPYLYKTYDIDADGNKTINIFREKNINHIENEPNTIWIKYTTVKIKDSEVKIQRKSGFDDYLTTYLKKKGNGKVVGFYECIDFNYDVGYRIVAKNIKNGRILSRRQVKNMMS